MAKNLIKFVLFVAVLSLPNHIGCTKSTESYVPLEEGRTWTYQVGRKRTGLSDNYSVKLASYPYRELEGKRVTPVEYKFKSGSIFYFLLGDANGAGRFARQRSTDVEPEITSPPYYYIKYPIQAGTNWEVKCETFLLKERLPITLNKTIESTDETVTVPAGTFNNCLKVKAIGKTEKNLGYMLGVAKISVEEHIWYAPGIGLVKSVRKENSNNLLVGSGEASSQLTSFKK